MGQLDLTTDEINKTLNGRYYNPLQDVSGNDYTIGSPLVMSADTEYDFLCNGAIRNFKNFPSHITNIWDTVNHKATFSNFLDTPVMVFTLRFKFDPDVASSGLITINPYVDETVPILFKPVTVPYKATITNVSALVTIYIGDEVGFDVKNKGVDFKITSSGAGIAYDPSIEIYRT